MNDVEDVDVKNLKISGKEEYKIFPLRIVIVLNITLNSIQVALSPIAAASELGRVNIVETYAAQIRFCKRCKHLQHVMTAPEKCRTGSLI